MRGVVSAGMVGALAQLGLTDAFDAVYGSSAGAINGAYFLAGQARLGTTIYAEDINNRQFIDLRRPLTGRSIVNLGFLLDDVAISRKPLDTARVLSAASPLTVMATDVGAARAVPLRTFASGRDLLTALRAGATMPVIAGPPVTYGGRAYLDASLTEPIPVPTAETDGSTHILVLLTRPTDVPRRSNALDRWYVMPRLRRLSPALAELYAGRSGPYAALVDRIAAGRGSAAGVEILGVRPEPPEVSKLERRADRLREAARRGFDAVLRAFGESLDQPRQR